MLNNQRVPIQGMQNSRADENAAISNNIFRS